MFNHAYVLSTVATSLAKCKRAHGGISTATIYLYEDRRIVSDVQYMKEMNESARSDRCIVRRFTYLLIGLTKV